MRASLLSLPFVITHAEALPTMLILRGAPALSSFRSQKLLSSLQQRIPAVTGVSSEFVHFAHISSPLSDAQQQVLKQLLTYG
ncbi:MAG TPA: hypothetical protein VIM59_16935, partial [Cellvibrio sp.]